MPDKLPGGDTELPRIMGLTATQDMPTEAFEIVRLALPPGDAAHIALRGIETSFALLAEAHDKAMCKKKQNLPEIQTGHWGNTGKFTVSDNPDLGQAERLAIARLREGTEILRTGGGTTLTADQCNALLDRLERLAARLAQAERALNDVVATKQWHRAYRYFEAPDPDEADSGEAG